MGLKEILKSMGITEYGVCSFEDIKEFLPCRNAERIPKGAKSVIVCAFSYYLGKSFETNVAKYAMLPDYHDVVREILNAAAKKLKAEFGGEYEAFSDISALPEKQCSELSGLGVRGKNNLIINKTFGSYFVIGEIITDMFFAPTPPLRRGCLNCGACVKACPVGAISENGVDYTKCLSAVTQRKGELSDYEQQKIKENKLMWGCDRCQDCCPMNRNAQKTDIEAFLRDVEPLVTRENLSTLMKNRAFGYKGKKLLLRNLDLTETK